MNKPTVVPDSQAQTERVDQMFPTLRQDQMGRITAQARRRQVKRGEVLYDVGDTALHFFVMTAGRVGVVRPSESGDNRVTTLLPG